MHLQWSKSRAAEHIWFEIVHLPLTLTSLTLSKLPSISPINNHRQHNTPQNHNAHSHPPFPPQNLRNKHPTPTYDSRVKHRFLA
ncbi:hypothetical protein VNO77_20883 [Canavalia gladiata]|uniref:Uncharacterized protein n=1 Tax=Canavalia gladiata TaxID=3824 RepID=A0AAN9QLT7_CANGL